LSTVEQVFWADLTEETAELNISGDEFHHLHRVRRFQVDDRLWIVNGSGLAALTVITRLDKRSARLQVEHFESARGEPIRSITLALAILKGDHFSDAVEKCTELGVTHIQPLVTDHTIKKNVNMERLNRIAVTAMKQSQRCQLPLINAPATFKEFCSEENSLPPFFTIDHPDAKPLMDILIRMAPDEAVTIMVGPEGGWSESEIDFAYHNGYTFTWLGPRRLRAETAASLAVGSVSSLQKYEPSKS